MKVEEGSYWLHNSFQGVVAQVHRIHGQQPLVHLTFPLGTAKMVSNAGGWVPMTALRHHYREIEEDELGLLLLGDHL